MRILVLCTGNSCRSQMAEGFLKSFDEEMFICSAGTNPSEEVHPKAIEVMKEIGINISDQKPTNVDKYLEEQFDYVITVCDNARENCPVFTGEVKNLLHIGFEDPAEARGTEEEILKVFRIIRDQIKDQMYNFYHSISGNSE